MLRSKKLIIAAVLATVMLAGSMGGVLLAADNGDDSQPGAKYGALLDRVCQIYEDETGSAINQEVLKDAFAQAQREMRTEALRYRLDSLIEQGKITQEQADELQDWWEARPDVPVRFGFRGHGGFRGMGDGVPRQNK